MKNRPRTILHVDDDPIMLRLVEQKLQAAGYCVITLSNPCGTPQILLENECRVVLLDIDMPDINGIELLQQIKRQDGGIQVVMLTGLMTMNTILESMRYGAEACIFKPIADFAPLLKTLEATFEKVDRWWETLRELQDRETPETTTVMLSH